MKFEQNPLVDDSLSGGSDTQPSHNVVNHPKSEKKQGAKHEFKNNVTYYFNLYKSKPILIAVAVCVLGLMVVAFNWSTFANLSTVWFKQVSEPDLPTGEVVQPLWVSQVNQLRDQFSEQIQQQKDSLESQANNLGTTTQSVQRAFQQAEQNAIGVIELQTHMDELNSKLDSLLSTETDRAPTSTNTEEIAALGQTLISMQSSLKTINQALNEEQNIRRRLQTQLTSLNDWKQKIEQAQAQNNQDESPQLTIEPTNPWKLIAASSQGNLAYIEHTGTGAKLRVILGTDVPHCGKVARIDAPTQHVLAGHCTIARSLPQATGV